VIGYILYGRLTSTRLPGKSLLDIDGKSLIAIARDRVLLSRHVEAVVFATSDEHGDDPVAAKAAAEGLAVHRGHPDDVLLRLTEAARLNNLEMFLTAPLDTPIQFAEVLDATVDLMQREALDLAYSFPEQPNGTDCYGVRTAAAERVLALKREIDTGAWGKYFTDTGLFQWGEVNLFRDAPHQKPFRLTIDYPEDFAFVTRLYRDLVAQHGPAFTLANLKELLDTDAYRAVLPQMIEMNEQWDRHFARTQSPVAVDVARIRSVVAGR
jgi:spore coat polysaccharide biosynthesis protein SpsF